MVKRGRPAMMRRAGDGKARESAIVTIATNRRAPFDYEIGASYEAGIVLVGSEVKALRAGKLNIVDAYASVTRGEMWLNQLNVGAFEMARSFPHAPRRARKLLLHKREILAIERAIAAEGATVIPLRLYFKDGRAKVLLGIAKGKKLHDKRHAIAKRTADDEARAAMSRGTAARRSTSG